MHTLCMYVRVCIALGCVYCKIQFQAPSSTASTPNKSHQPPFPSQHLIQGAMTDPSRLQQTSRLKKAKKPNSALPQLTGALAGEEEEEESDEDSEGEIRNSVTISALLSKLDSVRVSVTSALSQCRCYS